jgi:hypothetical protein
MSCLGAELTQTDLQETKELLKNENRLFTYR